MGNALEPRLLDRETAAAYLSVSVDTLDRLLQSGALHVVRLPVQRDRNTGVGIRGTTRRILLDRHELDRLVDSCREVLL
jgi:predicted site-specific integrase-resolvase